MFDNHAASALIAALRHSLLVTMAMMTVCWQLANKRSYPAYTLSPGKPDLQAVLRICQFTSPIAA